MIEIVLDYDSIEVGGFVSGEVRWKGDVRARRIIAAAQWATRGHGNRVWGVGRSAVFTPDAAARDAVYRFRLMIPHGGPVSFEGSLLTIAWTLNVRIDQRGFDELAEAPFRVKPRTVRRPAPPVPIHQRQS